jgi:predicted HicB family RNase H-like nuclease
MSNKDQEAKNKYLKEKVETFNIRVPKGQKVVIQEYAKSKGKSLNKLVIELLEREMKYDNWI